MSNSIPGLKLRSYEQACVNNSSFRIFWELLNSEEADSVHSPQWTQI